MNRAQRLMAQAKADRMTVPERQMEEQRRILAEDREGDRVFVQAIQAMQVSPRKVRTA